MQVRIANRRAGGRDRRRSGAWPAVVSHARTGPGRHVPKIHHAAPRERGSKHGWRLTGGTKKHFRREGPMHAGFGSRRPVEDEAGSENSLKNREHALVFVRTFGYNG